MGRVSQFDAKDSFSSGVYASKDTFGMRANAVVIAARANPDAAYEYPINGFQYTKSLSRYGNRDSVGIYADNSSLPFKKWELVRRVRYTPTSFSSVDLDTRKIKPGMLVNTTGSPVWSAFVVSVSKGKVITNGWVNNTNGSMGVPQPNQGIVLNPNTKIWATNFNIFLGEKGRAKSGVIQENGIINNSIENPNEVNGLDTVILPASKYGGTAAYLARSASSGKLQQWNLGFASQGAKVANFYSSDSSKKSTTEAGLMENSSANNGVVFRGRN
ncbi:hypothetical protein D5Q65_23290, partial [Escherichia coli]|nr:hypothetical protein [Escherichia coli]